MAQAIALSRNLIQQAVDPFEVVRAALVLACGFALILAGPAYPFA